MLRRKKEQRGAVWVDAEVDALLGIWGEEDVQSKLDGATRNIKVFETIASRLKDLGYERTAVQCREKIKKLKGEYRKICTHNNLTGRNRKTIRHLDQLDSILGHRPAQQPSVLLQSVTPAVVAEDGVDVQEQLHGQVKDDMQANITPLDDSFPSSSGIFYPVIIIIIMTLIAFSYS